MTVIVPKALCCVLLRSISYLYVLTGVARTSTYCSLLNKSMQKRNKTVLITGANGFLGGAIARRLLALGYELRLLIRKRQRYGRITEDFILNNQLDESRNGLFLGNAEIFEGDVKSECLGLGEGIYKKLCLDVDEVFHCAAATHFDKQRADEIMNVNINGTENMLLFANSERQKRFHYISTAYVAGKGNGVVFEDELDNEPQFNNEYERSKFVAEQIVVQYAKDNAISYAIYRPSIIVGDSRTGFTSKFDNLYLFAKVLLNIKNGYVNHQRQDSKDKGINVTIRVPGAPNALVNLVPIDYVAKAIVAISRKRDTGGKIFHIANPNPPTLNELGDLLMSALEIKGVDISIDGQMEHKRLSTIERLFLRQTRTYYPYIFSKLRFDCSNTQDTLKDTGISCPAISLDFIKILLDYAISHNWGEGEMVTSRKIRKAKVLERTF
jgi:thioester reductase-like protein